MHKLEDTPKIEEEKQVIEGKINDLAGFESGDWKKVLPKGLTLHDVDLFLKKEGWYWHMKIEHIKDEEERKKWEEERKFWTKM
jgi:hypothetical protein